MPDEVVERACHIALDAPLVGVAPATLNHSPKLMTEPLACPLVRGDGDPTACRISLLVSTVPAVLLLISMLLTPRPGTIHENEITFVSIVLCGFRPLGRAPRPCPHPHELEIGG